MRIGLFGIDVTVATPVVEAPAEIEYDAILNPLSSANIRANGRAPMRVTAVTQPIAMMPAARATLELKCCMISPSFIV
jgi:hypothetical protein